jgi:Plasmid pRiA4b ORF-3-like protein
MTVEGATNRPVCLGGDRRCPPEDVGGAYGYQEFLDAIFDPTHEDYDQFVHWAGGHFQAEEFDMKAVNEKLARMRWPVRTQVVEWRSSPVRSQSRCDKIGTRLIEGTLLERSAEC